MRSTLREAITEGEFKDMMAQLPEEFGQLVGRAVARMINLLGTSIVRLAARALPTFCGLLPDRRYPDPGGDWGLVALLVFKTSAPARVGGRVRFPSASASGV